MMIVKPLPDELANGHISRWTKVLGLSDENACVAVLRKQYANAGFGAITDPILAIAGKLCGLPVDGYVRWHSMLPLVWFAAHDGEPVADATWYVATSATKAFRTARPSAYFCAACALEDLAFWGYSYWRRAHQIPGAFWCEKHQHKRLHEVPVKGSFARMPHHWLGQPEIIRPAISRLVKDHPLVLRYMDVCRAMLASKRSLPASFMRRLLRDQAMKNKVRSSETAYIESARQERAYLSDIANERLPSSFMDRTFPGFEDKVHGGSFHSIDGASCCVHGGLKADATALALCLLYPSVHEAFDAIDAAVSTCQRERRGTPFKAKTICRKNPELWFGRKHWARTPATVRAASPSGQCVAPVA